MIVWAPGRFKGGRQVKGLCQQMDIGPTILELAGVEPEETMEAETLLPALEEGEWSPREYVFAEHGRDGILDGTEFMTMVRDNDWKLVHFVDRSDGQLFDLHNDPDEVNNLWTDPQYSDKRSELLGVLRDWRISSGARTAPWSARWR